MVFDAVWKISKAQGSKALVRGGKYLSVSSPTSETIEKLEYLNMMLENNELKTVIDKTYPLSAMKEAHFYVETGRKVGNVIINVSHD